MLLFDETIKLYEILNVIVTNTCFKIFCIVPMVSIDHKMSSRVEDELIMFLWDFLACL